MKTQASISSLFKYYGTGFHDSENPSWFPSYRSMKISAIEAYARIFDGKPDFSKPLTADEMSSVSRFLRARLSLPVPSSLDNCLTNKRVVTPRFHKLNVKYFKKVNKLIDARELELTKQSNAYWDNYKRM